MTIAIAAMCVKYRAIYETMMCRTYFELDAVHILYCVSRNLNLEKNITNIYEYETVKSERDRHRGRIETDRQR